MDWEASVKTLNRELQVSMTDNAVTLVAKLFRSCLSRMYVGVLNLKLPRKATEADIEFLTSKLLVGELQAHAISEGEKAVSEKRPLTQYSINVFGKKLSKNAIRYMFGVVIHVMAELIEVSSLIAKGSKKVTTRHLAKAIKEDKELAAMYLILVISSRAQ